MASTKAKPPVITLLRVPKTAGPPPEAQSHLPPSFSGAAPPEFFPETLSRAASGASPEAIAAQLVPDFPSLQSSQPPQASVPAAFMNPAPQQQASSGSANVPAAFRNRMAANNVAKTPPNMRPAAAVASATAANLPGVTAGGESGAAEKFGWDAFLGGSQGMDMWSAMQASMAAGAMQMQGMPGASMWPDLAGGGMAGMAAGMDSMWQAAAAASGTAGAAGAASAASAFGVAGSASEEAAAPAAAAASAGQSDVSSEQAAAIQEAVAATQRAQYEQQVQFLQQLKKYNQTQTPTGASRFRDDYRAFRLCRSFATGVCWQGARCVYAHCFEELHPASPDMPKDEEGESSAISEMKPVKEEKEAAPNMRLRKKRDLCRKFMETGECMRGNACPNAHGEAEIGKMAFVLYDKVKLTICNHWERGKCGYGDNCIHAHGDHEIGQKRREFFEMPPVKRRKDGETMEEWRNAILKNPGQPSFLM